MTRCSVCPDNTVLDVGMPGKYSLDLDYCKGCGICVSECPYAAATSTVPCGTRSSTTPTIPAS